MAGLMVLLTVFQLVFFVGAPVVGLNVVGFLVGTLLGTFDTDGLKLGKVEGSADGVLDGKFVGRAIFKFIAASENCEIFNKTNNA